MIRQKINTVIISILLLTCLAEGCCILYLLTKKSPASFPIVHLVSVYDGDTFKVDIESWPEIVGDDISIRIRGIDAPEIRDKRPEIKTKAYESRDFLKEALNQGQIHITNIDRDKYFRILADVYVNNQNIAELMLESKNAKVYGEKW